MTNKESSLQRWVYKWVRWFVGYAWLFFLLTVLLLIFTPFFIYFRLDVSPKDALYVSIVSFMGDAIDGGGIYAVMTWGEKLLLLLLRVVGWLILPFLISIMLQEYQNVLQRQQEERLKLEAFFTRYESKVMKKNIGNLVSAGFTPERASEIVELLGRDFDTALERTEAGIRAT